MFSLVLAVTLSVPLSVPSAEQEMELSRAIDLALKQNREIRKTMLSLEISGFALERANFDFMFNITPKVSGEITGDSDSARYGLDVTKKNLFGTEARVGVLSSKDNLPGVSAAVRNSIAVEVKQPLLRRLGRLVNEESIKQATSTVRSARRQYEIQKTDLVVQVVMRHEELLMLQRRLEYEEKTVERLSRLSRLTQVREKQGRVTRVDVLRSDLRFGNAQLQLNNTRERLQSLRADYAEMLGFPPATEFKVLPSPLVTVLATNLETAVDSALHNRLDYAQILQDADDARRGISIARRNLLPDLSMISRYELKGDGEKMSDAKLDDNVWFVGLSLESDFPMRNERLALSEAMIHSQLTDLRIEEVKSAVARQVQQEMLDYERAQQQISFAERNYQVARDRARLARRLYEMHKGDNFTVTDAEDELTQAEIQLLSAQSEASTASYKLKRVLGTLIDYPADLKPQEEK
jgi:outer membrane protein TolC